MGLFKKISQLLDKDRDAAYADEYEADALEAQLSDGYSPDTLDRDGYRFVEVLHAVGKGDKDCVQRYLDFDSHYAECVDWEDNSLLQRAAQYAQADIAALLLQHGAAIESRQHGLTPLHRVLANSPAWGQQHRADLTDEAYQHAQVDTLKTLLNGGADIHAYSDEGENALHLAARHGHYLSIALLLSRGADLESHTQAPQVAHADTEDEDEPPTIPIAQGKATERTPLLLVARHSKHAKLIMFLMEKGADTNACDAEPGYSVLHYLAAVPVFSQVGKEKALAELARQCLKHGANPNLPAKAREKETPLHLAARNNHVYLAHMLLKGGANLKAKTHSGQTPMSMAASQGALAMVQCLGKHGIDMNKSLALLHAAACPHSTKVLEWLLARGVDVNQTNPKGMSAIFPAIKSGSLANVKLLLDHKIDLKLHPTGMKPSQQAFAYWGALEALPDDKKDPKKLEEAKQMIELLGGFDSLKQRAKTVYTES